MSKGIKIVTIGGGSSYTPELVEGFIKRHNELPVKELWLVDIEEGKEKLEIVSDLARRMVKKAGVDMKIYSTLDRREALKDADFVTTQMRVGLLQARIKDERIPLSHGEIGQETNGAGGMFKGLRTIPVILDIIKDVEELCPNAWVINFTNPAGMVTEAVLKHTNFKRFIGLCNVPIGMQRSVAQAFNVEPRDVNMLFGGLNHMVYGLKVEINGEEKSIPEVFEATRNAQIVKNLVATTFNEEFIKSLNALPCPYHRYYYKRADVTKQELEQFSLGKTRGEVVKALEDELFELYKDPTLDIKPPQLEQRGGAYYSDASCNLINSIYNDKRDIQVVNTVNQGAIADIDYDSAVEVSCYITKSGPIPLRIGKMPIGTRGLINQIKSFEVLVAESAVEGNYDKLVQALCINPLNTSDTEAKLIIDELLVAHKEYLPNFADKIAEIEGRK